MGYFYRGQCYASLVDAAGASASFEFPRMAGGNIVTAQVNADGSLRVSTVDASLNETFATYPVSFSPCDPGLAVADVAAGGGLLVGLVVVIVAVVLSFRPLLVNP